MTVADASKGLVPAEEPNAYTKVFGRPIKRSLLKTFASCVLFLTCVASITFAPIMMHISYYSTGGVKLPRDKYVPSTVHASSFFVSIWIGLALTALLHGKEMLKGCFDYKMIIFLFPVSAGYSASEMLALTAMGRASPMMYATIHKLRLLLAAFMTRFVLRRPVSTLQWTICVTVTSCVFSFVFHSKTSGGDGDMIGVVLLIINITVSVACSIYADWAYKKNKYPLTVQMVQGRISASIASALIAVGYMAYFKLFHFGWFGGPYGGWDRFVMALAVYNIFRDWITTVTLLYLDALIKSLGGSAAVATTYLASSYIFGKPIELVKCFMVGSIMCSCIIYALARRAEQRLKRSQEREAVWQAKMQSVESPAASVPPVV